MEFKDVIQNRYSCKDFLHTNKKEKLMEILEAGRVAPTAKTCKNKKSMLFNQRIFR